MLIICLHVLMFSPVFPDVGDVAPVSPIPRVRGNYMLRLYISLCYIFLFYAAIMWCLQSGCVLAQKLFG